MNFTVTGITVETRGMTPEQLEQAKIFSGKNAGICYMGDSYFDSAVSDPAKALPRFVDTANNAHHSIADHVRVEVLLEGISKMLAIVLNSLQDYATSEKSGRYTIMTGNSEKECELYEKWCKIYQDIILAEEPDIDDVWLSNMLKNESCNITIHNGEFTEKASDLGYEKLAKLKSSNRRPSRKKAQENARYVLSVFTRSTTMGYSTSLRQWNYILDWCGKYMSQFEPLFDENYAKALAGDNSAHVTLVYKGTWTPITYFERELYFDMLKLCNFINDNLYVDELRDTKNRYFEFLVNNSGESEHPMKFYDLSAFEPDAYTGKFIYNENTHSDEDIVDTVYQVAYPASFVHIAQAERHRTLQYFMFYNPHSSISNWFIPPMIHGTEYEEMWIEDLESVKDIIPQATQVMIVETGHISKFLLKCEERLCGRAQWETMNQTMLTAQRFIDKMKSDPMSCSCVYKSYVKKMQNESGGVTTKCQMLGCCKEPCKGGARNALSDKRKF